MCDRCNSTNYGETLKVRSGEHTRISPLTFRKTKPSKESSICDHLFAVISRLLRSVTSWQMEIINSFLKSKKAC